MRWRSLLNIFLVTAIVVTQSLLVAIPTSASILTSASLTLTNHQASSSADHTIEFVTPSGVDASTDTIVVKLESGFTLSSLSAPGDFDLAVDDDNACDGPFSDKTLAASAAAGTWGVGVSGQLITFTAPTDAAPGEITASRCVQIQIGTVASGGANQITNPGSSGSYEIDIYGTFGDQALYSVGIIAAGAHTVTAVVPASGGGAPPPPPPPGDTTAPVVSNIVVSNITTSGATVTWSTNEPAQSELFHGVDTGYTGTSLPDASYRTSHTRTLSGLLEGTEYHFYINVNDSSSNVSNSADQTFTTLDLTPPIISNIQVINITETTATVTWDTNELANSSVAGTFTTVNNATLVLAHSVNLTGLAPGTLYPFEIISSDASTNIALAFSSFTTLADLPPTNVGSFVVTPGDSQVVLSWVNSLDADFDYVTVWVSTTAFPTSVGDGVEIYQGSDGTFTHVGLANGTTYYYTIFAVDLAGNVSSGASASTTAVGPPPVLAISNVSVINITQTAATITWDTNIASDSTVRFGDGTTFFDGSNVTSHSMNVGPLSPSTIYSVKLNSFDGSTTVSAVAGFTTLSVVTTPVVTTPVVIPPVATPLVDDGGGATSTDVTTPDDSTIDEPVVDETPVEPVTPIDEVVPPTPGTLIPRSEVSFLVARDAVSLTPTPNNAVRVLAGRGLAVNLNLVNAPADIVSVQLSVGGSTFQMNPESRMVAASTSAVVAVGDEHLYSARVISPSSSGPMVISISYLNGEVQTMQYTLEVQSDGIVLDEETRNAVEGATVSLFSSQNGFAMWNAIPYAQNNPIYTTNNGLFAWYVPNGTYQIKVIRDGYSSVSTARFGVANNVVNIPVELIALLPPISEEIKIIGDVVPVLSKHTIQAIKVFRQNPTAQDTADIATPVVAVTAASTIALLATSFNGIRFLQYLFTAPFLLLKRRRRKEWGVVYDSLRKVPVDLAIVRLIDAATNRTVKSQVTDKEGRFLFVVDAGEYKIDVRKAGFSFPTGHLRDLKVDGDFLDLYHGEMIEVKDRDATIAVNIPADPVGQEVTVSRKAVVAKWFRRFMYVVSVAGLFVAIGVAMFDPSLWTIGIAVAQIIVLGMFIKLAIPKKPKSWGIVYDEISRRPLGKAIVRIFDPKFNKLLETKITDSSGRYAFLVGPSEFYTTYEKNGYQKVEVRPIDRTDTKEASYVSMDVPMNKNR